VQNAKDSFVRIAPLENFKANMHAVATLNHKYKKLVKADCPGCNSRRLLCLAEKNTLARRVLAKVFFSAR